jgi:cell division protein FtsI (penicillin-binding protein 3)
MARARARIGLLQATLALGLLVVVGRAAQVQIFQGKRWAEEARESRTEVRRLEARRGTLYDRNGLPLAVTQEFYRVGIAPREVTDPTRLTRAAARQLGIPAASLRRGLSAGKPYLYYYGPFTATQVAPLRGYRGVHIEGDFLRFYPARELARKVIGGLDAEGEPASGLERALGSFLAGTPGEAVVLKDRRGRRYESPGRLRRDPTPGQDVVLTIDAELQDIAEQSLSDAIREAGAQGGDVLFLDPHTGEILAVASQWDGQPDLMAFTSPFEPGSTAKLFTAAALLALGRVDSTDAVSGENGRWVMTFASGNTRSLEDTHKEPGQLTLAQAIEVSSNIAMAKFSQRLSTREQYDQLRAFGFGSPTGIELPSESRGVLRRPDRWRPDYSGVSHAIGYEFEVTALQLALAYGAIANDGVLLSPALVKEVRAPDGTVRYRHQPEPVRRVVTPEVAARLRDFLRGASSRGGTGSRAQLGTYGVLGKTGTSRRVRDGRYVPGEYTATFAAMFPAEDPQLVVVVKIDNPTEGGYYGGEVAAPVVRSMLEQALSSRRVALDRSRLTLGDSGDPATPRRTAPAPVAKPVVMPWPPRPDTARRQAVTVPRVTGANVRDAALAIHRRGLRVVLQGQGRVVKSTPAAGEAVSAGSSVTIMAE